MQAKMNPTLEIPKTCLLGTPAGDLVLTIRGGEHDGRVLRLAAAKCLIGSAAGCTLRLRARGIRPVHALILRGPMGSIVRCWSPDAQLNERSFTEASLAAGDTLQIGPIQLVVSELRQPLPVPHSAFNKLATPTSPSRPVRRRRRKQLFDFLRQEREQQTNLQATIANQREQLNSLNQQALPTQQRPSDDCLSQQLAKTVEQLRQELDAAAKRRALEQHSAARQRAAWEELAAQRLQTELANLTGELARKSEQEVAAERQAANIVQDQLRAELTTLSQQRQALTREIDSLKLSFETMNKSEGHSRQSAASQIEQLSHAFDLVRQERDDLFQRVQDDQRLLDEQTARAQAQLDEARRGGQAQLREVKTAAQTQVALLREESATRERQWNEEQDGFTQARKRLEADIAALNSRVKQSEQALHEARDNSGQLQVAVLAEAEQARNERDAVREQMLRQQQDWTEFRSRLESAATEERKAASDRCEALQAQLVTRSEEHLRSQQECQTLQQTLARLQTELEQGQKSLLLAERNANQRLQELEQSQEALFVAEHGANNRLQQMTVSMEQLQLDRGSTAEQLEQARADWERERNSLAQCVAELQLQVTQLTESLTDLDQQARTSTSESLDQIESKQQQLGAAQEQLTHWQTAAQDGKRRCEELLQSVSGFQQQEQAWQRDREQLAVAQQQSTDRLQHLETAISDLQQQLSAAQQAAAAACEPAAPSAPQSSLQPSGEFAGSTININNQDLAALQEQMHEPVPSLLAPRDFVPVATSAALQAREAELQAQSEGILLQQGQLEEQQAIVARQRIELEQFQASLLELKQSLKQKALELQKKSEESAPPSVVAALDDYHDSSYAEEIELERESNPLSESEAFASMADQVAALYHTPAAPAEDQEFSYDSPATFSSAEEFREPAIPTLSSPVIERVEPASEYPMVSRSLDAPIAAVVTEKDDEFDRQLDARIARVMRREKSNWEPAPATANDNDSNVSGAVNIASATSLEPGAEEEAPTKSQAVSSVLDRLREAGVWKGEGTAQADQLPGSIHQVEAGGTGICRASPEGPIVGDSLAEDQIATSTSGAAAESEDLSSLATWSAPSTKADNSADDSIESYMSRLMQRLRPGDEVESAPRKAAGQAANRTSQAPATPVTPPAPKLSDSTPLTSLKELAPRSPAPELSSNLAAMRELANSAARGAIESHHQRRGQKRVTAQTINTVLAVLVAAGLVFYWSRTGSWLALGGVAISLLCAVSASLVAALQTAALRKSGRTAENRSDAN